MSINAQVHLSNNDNNKKNDKTLKQLFSKREECSHVSCYWQVFIYVIIQNNYLRIVEKYLNNVLLLFSSVRKTSGNYVKMCH